jgi:hypothetical protein
VASISVSLFCECQELCSDATTSAITRNTDRRNVWRTREAVLRKEDEAESRARVRISSHEELGPRARKRCATAFQITFQSNPRLVGGHKARTPFGIIRQSRCDVEWVHCSRKTTAIVAGRLSYRQTRGPPSVRQVAEFHRKFAVDMHNVDGIVDRVSLNEADRPGL